MLITSDIFVFVNIGSERGVWYIDFSGCGNLEFEKQRVIASFIMLAKSIAMGGKYHVSLLDVEATRNISMQIITNTFRTKF